MVKRSTQGDRRAILLAILACSNAMAVVSLYLPQVVLPLIFPETPDRHAWLPVMAVFLGYCLGNAITAFDLIPIISRSIRFHLGVLSGALVLTTLMPTMLTFGLACFFTGVGASVAQRLLGLAAQLVEPRRAGMVVTACIAAALLAVLGLRVIGLQFATVFGWKTTFLIMSVPFLIWTVWGHSLLSRVVIKDTTAAPIHLMQAQSIWQVNSSSILRRSMAQQAMVFASYNAGWMLVAAQPIDPELRTAASFLGPLAGVICLVVAGFLINRERALFLNRLGNGAMLILGCPLLIVAYSTMDGVALNQILSPLVALSLGMAMVDAGMQLTLASNHLRVQDINHGMRGQLASLLTISGSLGGAFGGGLGQYLCQHQGWSAALILVAATGAGGLIVAYAPNRTKAWNQRSRALVLYTGPVQPSEP